MHIGVHTWGLLIWVCVFAYVRLCGIVIVCICERLHRARRVRAELHACVCKRVYVCWRARVLVRVQISSVCARVSGLGLLARRAGS